MVKMKIKKTDSASERNALVDNVKGLVIIFFIVTNVYFLANLTFKMPEWSIHEGDVNGIPLWSYLNFSLMDLGPAIFFFLIGLTVFPTFSRHTVRDGSRAAYKRFFMRNMTIVGIFCTITFIKSKLLKEINGATEHDWDTIQSIGFTGVLLTPFLFGFMRRHAWARVLAGLGVLVLFQLFHKEINIFHSYQGGLAACVGYLGIVLVSSALGDAMRKGIIAYAAASLLLAGAAVLSDRFFGKAAFFEDYNTTYMLMAATFINTVYFAFYVIDKLVLKGRRIPVLSSMGRNLFLYLLISLAVMAVTMIFLADVPLNQTRLLLLEIGVVAAYLLLGIFLEKKNITFKL
ncbi:MAG: hypothetical protein LBP79_05645 [Clostridiales bacterium]|jgi:hypothetical protein|nr:hypothetical protein [Clostridiales bacterium]